MRSSWSGALAAAALLADPALCRAYLRSTATDNPAACLYWASREIPFTLDASGSAGADPAASLAAARLSFQQWETPPCTDVVFKDKGTSSERIVGIDSVNRVLRRDRHCSDVPGIASDPCKKSGGCGNKYDCWEDSVNGKDTSTIIALTTVFHNTRTGEIVEADIELNGANYTFTTVDGPPCQSRPTSSSLGCVAIDVRNTLTHEIGHVLGLDHTSVKGSTMFPTALLGETSKRVLHEDDVAGLCAIYPRGKPTWTCVAQEQGGCSAAPGAAPMLALSPILLAALAKRRRPAA